VITADAENTYTVTPQFIPSTHGRLFSLFYTPTQTHDAGANYAILYFPPFAEELNKSRRMVSLQAGQFSHAGYAVLVVDLFGTGDSEGDFSAASWEIWQQNMELALNWLEDKGFDRFIFWSLRSGVFLALQTAAFLLARDSNALAKFIFWQPTVQGDMLMTQFLRLRMAADFLVSGNQNNGNDNITPTTIRQKLSQGHNVEIAGYSVSPELLQSIDGLNLKTLKPAAGSKVVWFEILPTETRTISPNTQGIVKDWRSENIEIETVTVVGKPFWNSLEIMQLPELLEATTQRLLQADL